MKNKLFHRLALEDADIDLDELDLTDVNYTDNVIALDKQLRGIDAAVESYQHMQRLQEIISNYRERKLSKETVKLVNIASENIKQSLAVFSNEEVVSLESLSGENNIEICLESIGGFLKRIWKAIVDAFNYIWQKIKSFFGVAPDTEKLKLSVEKTEEKLKKISKEIEQSPEKNKVLKDFKPEPIEAEDIAYPLAFRNKPWKDEDLLKFADDMIRNVERIKLMLSDFKVVSMNIRHALLEIGPGTVDFSGFRQWFVPPVNMYYTSIENNLEKASVHDIPEKDLREASNSVLSIRNVNANTVRMMGPFIYNTKFYLFRTNSNDSDYYYKLVDIQKTINSKSIPNVLSFQALELFQRKVVKLFADLTELSEEMKAIEKKILPEQREYLQIVGRFIDELNRNIIKGHPNPVKNDFRPDMQETINLLRIMILSFTKSCETLMHMFQVEQNTALCLAKLGDYCADWYDSKINDQK